MTRQTIKKNTMNIQNQKATEFVSKFRNKISFKEVERELEKVNRFLLKELKISKDLRNINFLMDYLKLRRYYKTVLKLLK